MVKLSEIDNQTMEDTSTNCLMLFPTVGECGGEKRVYRCKTCMKEFSTFQGLGGHRTSHKKSITKIDDRSLSSRLSTKKSQTTTSYMCPICGMEFSMGQALGGHMRKHRNEQQSVPLVIRSLLPDETLNKSSNGNRMTCSDLVLDSKKELDLNLKLGM